MMSPAEVILLVINSWEGWVGLTTVFLALATALWRQGSGLAKDFKAAVQIGGEFRTNGGSTLRTAIDGISAQLQRMEAIQIAHVGVVYHLCGELDVALLYTDAHSNCVWVSRAWCVMSGMAFEDAIGQGWRSAIDPRDRDGFEKEWATCIRDQRLFRADFRYLRADNLSVWVRGHANSAKDHVGKLHCMIMSCRLLDRPVENYSPHD